MRVIMSLFSGRPNPEWHPSETDAKLIREKLDSAMPLPNCCSNANHHRLGYRGFVIVSNERKIIEVANRIIVINDKCFDDNGLEAMLMRMAIENNYGDFIGAYRERVTQ